MKKNRKKLLSPSAARSAAERVRPFVKRADAVLDRLNGDSVYAYAAQASFSVCISAVPFLMLLLAVLRFFLPMNAEDLLVSALELLPRQAWNAAETVVTELYASGITLISVTAVILLWSASAGIRSIADGVRCVYGNRLTTGFVRRYAKSLLYTVVFLLFLLVTVLVLPFGRRIWELVIRFTRVESLFGETLVDLRGLISYLFLGVVFLFLFRALAPKGAGMRWKDHLPGAAAAAAGWVLYSWAYALYVDNYADYSVIYGSLTAVILFMLWLYMSMLILLLGAELNVWLYGKKSGKKRPFTV